MALMVKPGDYAVVTGTLLEAIRTRNLGAALIELGTRGHAYHALIAISPTQAIEARPHGAGYVNISQYGNHLTWSTTERTPEQRGRLVAAAESFVGTPYGWDDDLAIALSVLHIRCRWVIDRLQDPSTVMCSQMVALCYVQAGIPLTDKDPALTTPNDLLHLIEHEPIPKDW